MAVTFKGKSLLVGGKPFYLRGADIHYFRLPRSAWKDRLKKARDAGVNTISSYSPWFFHEPEEGTADFEGTSLPERNLQAFIGLCADLDLKFVARPGPFVNSELRYGGYPRWVFERYPQTMSRRADGNPVTGRVAPAEGDPKLRELVKHWYSLIVPLLAARTEPKGGPVILFQPDNELSAAWTYGFTTSLYDPSITGKDGFWPRWLEERHGTIAALSERYGTKIESWQEAKPPVALPENPPDYRRAADWLEFKRQFFAGWGLTLAGWAREFGIDVPITFNEPVAGFYTHGDHTGFGAAMKRAGLEGFTTCHTYTDRIFDLEGVNSIEVGIELMKASPWGGPPISIEANNTWYILRNNRNHQNCPGVTRLGLGRGLNGVTCYVFAAGVNPEGSTLMGKEYWEEAPISRAGTFNPPYDLWKDFFSFVKAWEPEILATETDSDLFIGITGGLRYIDFMGLPGGRACGTAVGGPSSAVNPEPGARAAFGGHEWLGGADGVTISLFTPDRTIWKDLLELLILLRRMNRSWGAVDLCHPCRKPGGFPLIVPCVGAMEKEAITYLLEHFRQGGKALFYPTIPFADLDGKPDNRIAELLGVAEGDRIPYAGGDVLDYGWRICADGAGNEVGIPSWIFLHRFARPGKVFLSYQGRPLIAQVPAGKGNAVVCGCNPYLGTHAHLTLWSEILSGMRVKRPVTVSPYLHALLRKNPKSGATLLTLANLSGETRPVTVTLADSGLIFPANVPLVFSFAETRCLWISAPVAGTTLLYSTHELLPETPEKRSFLLRGRPGDEWEISFADRVKISVDGTRAALRKTGNGYCLTGGFGERSVVHLVLA